MVGAISSTLPIRPAGMWPISLATSSGAPCIGAVIGVSMVPGATALTRMPYLAHLTARLRVTLMIPDLAALYPGTSGTARSADIDARLTTLAPPVAVDARSAVRSATVSR